MIQVSQLRLLPGTGDEARKKKITRILRLPPEKITGIRILRRSIDARRKDQILEIVTAAVSTTLSEEKEEALVKKIASKDVKMYRPVIYSLPAQRAESIPEGKRPVVAGFGPAGIFISYLLARQGFRPLVLERGYGVEERKIAVETFFQTGKLDECCNVQFGEGGAGTFSDGKLNTLVKDAQGRNRFVLETFVRFGAPEEILYEAKPHLGTDKLQRIIPRIREEIVDLGGEIRFGSCLADLTVKDGFLQEVILENGEKIPARALFLCIGHSARDTFRMLQMRGFAMEAKAFAVGVRAEHLREMIDEALHYPKASYKMTHHCRDGRGVYTFCMCPGGYVVNASSEEEHLTVNGMSYSGRSGKNSNAAVVVTVSPEDFGGDPENPLRGIAFQQELEKKAHLEGNGKIPYQTYGDFKTGKKSPGPGAVLPCCKGDYTFGNLRNILPDFMAEDLIEGMEAFEKQIPGFAAADTLLAGIEGRTSCPVRILRDENYEAVGIRGVYPAGEGAGYAGGIMSAAMDGMKCAEAFVNGTAV